VTSHAAIAATATAVPPHLLTRDEVKTYIRRVFRVDERRLDAMMSVVDNAQVQTRHAIFPVEYIVEPRSLTQKTCEYQTYAIALGRAAAEQCLLRAGMSAQDVDLIITVSCTGFMIPSLDAHWNVAVVDSIGLGVVTDGPFRFVRHPNYAAVFVELIALPLIHTAWVTALCGGVAHIWVLSRRLAVEDAVLLADPRYRSLMGRKPRFLPKLL
jgi:hypothetical protein